MAGLVPPPDANRDDPFINFLTGLAGVAKKDYLDPMLGSEDQWAVAQQKAQAGDDSMLRTMLETPMAGWVTPRPNDEPALGTPEHGHWVHNQIMNQAMQLAGSGVIAGEGALGAGEIPASQWYRGADNLRRFEIPDFQSKLNMPEVQQILNERDKVAPTSHVIGEIGEILDHPELYKHYPDAAKIPMYIAPTVGEHAMHPMTTGAYIKPTADMPYGAVMLNPQVPVRDAKGTVVTDAQGNIQQRPATADELHASVMHEVNHYVQEASGFSGGTSPAHVVEQLRGAQAQIDARVQQLRINSPGHPDIAKLLNESDNIDQILKYDPHQLYSTAAGEVESGNVEDRLRVGKELLQRGMSPDEINRRLGLPLKTQAVPNAQQLTFPNRSQPTANQIKLQPVEHTPETAPMPQLIPIDHDPFTEPK